MVKPGAERVGTGLHALKDRRQPGTNTMADPRKPAPTAPGAKTTTEEPRPETAPIGDKGTPPEDVNKMRTELDELKGRNKKINRGVRKLAAAILTPGGEADAGAGRRNVIAQAFNELVRDLGFEDDE